MKTVEQIKAEMAEVEAKKAKISGFGEDMIILTFKLAALDVELIDAEVAEKPPYPVMPPYSK